MGEIESTWRACIFCINGYNSNPTGLVSVLGLNSELGTEVSVSSNLVYCDWDADGDSPPQKIPQNGHHQVEGISFHS